MSTIRPLDVLLTEQLFESAVERGSILDFSLPSLAKFLNGEAGCDLMQPKYEEEGPLALNRLTCLLQKEDNFVALQVVQSLWEYRENRRLHKGEPERVPNVQDRLDKLLRNLQGATPDGVVLQGSPTFLARISQLRDEYEQIALEPVPQRRGYMLEAFLNDLFIAWGLMGRKAFKLKGEQIDGSFSIDSNTYLVEAKWEAALTAAEALNNFHMKVQSKSAFTRGLFVSQAGYSADGLEAFRIASERVICLDGADLREAFLRGYPVPDVIRRKARRFDETGFPFVSVKELFRG
jgi:hypothetical protein